MTYSLLKNAMIPIVLILGGLGLMLALAGMGSAIIPDISLPPQGGHAPTTATAGMAHSQLIFLYQANLDGSIAERQRAATWLRTNATWVFEVEDTDEETPAMPGPSITTKELREVLDALQVDWRTKTLEELEAEFDLNAQLTENLVGLLDKGFPVSEADIQMGVKTLWIQQRLGPAIIARRRELE